MFFLVQRGYISSKCVVDAHRRVGLAPLDERALSISAYRQAKKLGARPEHYGLTAEDVKGMHNRSYRRSEAALEDETSQVGADERDSDTQDLEGRQNVPASLHADIERRLQETEAENERFREMLQTATQTPTSGSESNECAGTDAGSDADEHSDSESLSGAGSDVLDAVDDCTNLDASMGASLVATMTFVAGYAEQLLKNASFDGVEWKTVGDAFAHVASLCYKGACFLCV